MTRIPLLDPHAQAASRITGQGYVLVPNGGIGDNVARDLVEDLTPFPREGGLLFVGEACSPWPSSHLDPSHPMYLPPRWRAAGEHKTGGRWRAARTLPEHMARSRFRVLARSALRLGDVTEEMASGMGIERAETPRHLRDVLEPAYLGPVTATDLRDGCYMYTIREALDAFRAWWPLWTKQPYNPASWVFIAHVERL